MPSGRSNLTSSYHEIAHLHLRVICLANHASVIRLRPPRNDEYFIRFNRGDNMSEVSVIGLGNMGAAGYGREEVSAAFKVLQKPS